MQQFVSLHLNSEYSILQSTIKLDALFNFALKHNLNTLVLTDHNVMFGVSEFLHKCYLNKIKPIIGLDLDVEDFRLILLAKNYAGYKTLIKLSSTKMQGQTISLADINDLNLIIIDHPTYGYYKTHNKVLKFNNFYIGTTQSLNFNNSVYVNDTRILESSDENDVLSILNQIGTNQLKTFNLKPYPLNLDINLPEVKRVFEIIDNCHLDWPHVELQIPKFQTPSNLLPFDYLKQLTIDRAKELFKNQTQLEFSIKEYQSRIEHELKIIKDLAFSDYFLIIYDIVNFAKQQGIAVGPGRGSVSGSLVAYVLNITEVDPLKFDLLFERFLNPNRVSMPDIDLDFQDNRRDEIINYIFEKYGVNNVGLISTFQRLGPKMALRDVGRHLEINNIEVDQISKSIPNLVNAPFINSLQGIYDNVSQFRALITKKTIYQELFKKAQLIEGLPRQHGTHAAGIVISQKPLNETAPTLMGPNNLNQIQFPMDYLEEQGLLKIDILGLRTLTILQEIQTEIMNNHHHKINLQQISLSDKLTNELLTRGDTNGIFQLESYGMKKTLAQVGVDSVEDVTAVISLYRPGPMDNIKLYIDGKKHNRSTKINPEIDDFLKSTHGIIVYQEQIMKLVQQFSGMSFGEADVFRRAIGKKDKTLLDSLKLSFIAGAQSKGYDLALIEQVYAYIAKFANFGFNKSHAVAYAILSYRLAYLKAHFPLEFYTAILNASLSSLDTIKTYINEIKSRGITVISPEINLSQNQVFNYQGQIILPFNLIKGIGQSANQKILESRIKPLFDDFFEAISYLKLVGVGDSTLLLLTKANAFRTFANMAICLASLPIAIRYTSMVIEKTSLGSKHINLSLVAKPNLVIKAQNLVQEVEFETQMLGLPINAFLTLPFEDKHLKLNNLPWNKTTKVAVLIEKISKFKTKQGQIMGSLLCSDSSGAQDVIVFPEVWKHLKIKNIINHMFYLEINKTIKDNLTVFNLVGKMEEINNE